MVQAKRSLKFGPIQNIHECIWSISNGFQFSLVSQSCLTLCDPMDCSTPGFSVHHQPPEPTQIHVHHVSDAIQPSNLSQMVLGKKQISKTFWHGPNVTWTLYIGPNICQPWYSTSDFHFLFPIPWTWKGDNLHPLPDILLLPDLNRGLGTLRTGVPMFWPLAC